MLPDELVFAPERAKLRMELLYSVLGICLVGPALLWWKAVSWVWWPVCLGIALAVALARDLYAHVRGRDFVYVTADGIRVTNKRKVWLMRWQDIHRVHRFEGQLVFETVPPHRRETLSLHGHDARRRELFEAIASRARVLNLGWVETLGDAFG